MGIVLSSRPDTRYLVLDTALTLFTGRGYFSISVHDIGREAGVSIGSI
jgi:AcrR family transcriptional regulator